MYSLNFHHLLLLQSSDSEISPGPMKPSKLIFCHLDLSGIASHDFLKVTLIESFIKANNIDIICSSEIFLDSTIPLNDGRLYIKRYSMITADHPSNTKGRIVCIYSKEYVPLIRKVDICALNECILTEITVNKKFFLTYLYRSPNQHQEQFEYFFGNLIDVLSGVNNQLTLNSSW